MQLLWQHQLLEVLPHGAQMGCYSSRSRGWCLALDLVLVQRKVSFVGDKESCTAESCVLSSASTTAILDELVSIATVGSPTVHHLSNWSSFYVG